LIQALAIALLIQALVIALIQEVVVTLIRLFVAIEYWDKMQVFAIALHVYFVGFKLRSILFSLFYIALFYFVSA